jgi:hypothetical protein
VGTEVRLEWGPRDEGGLAVWPFVKGQQPQGDGYGWFRERFRGLVEGFALFNPHATITLDWFGTVSRWEATDRAWEKWKPHDPIAGSAHWYEQRHLERLIGAYITHERETGADRLVSEFLAGFDGLAGSAKRTKVLTEAGLKRVRLSEFVVDGRLDGDRIAGLLSAMRAHTKPVNPKRLGLIGEEHLKQRLLAMGVLPESFRYTQQLSGAKSKKSQPPEDGKSNFPNYRGPWNRRSAGWVRRPRTSARSAPGPTGRRRSRTRSGASGRRARGWKPRWPSCT